LTAEAVVASGALPGLLVVDPSDKFLYVEDQVGTQSNETGIQSFTIGASASLTASLAVGEPTAGSLAIFGGSTAVAYTPQFAYTANQGFSNISGFQVNATTGALTAVAGSPFASGGSQTIGIVADPWERFVFGVNASGSPNTVSAFTVTPSSGALAAAGGSPFATSGFSNVGTAGDASGRFVYTVSAATNEVSEFSVNQSTGALTTISGSPFATVGTAPQFNFPSSIANSPFGSTLFVPNENSETVAILSIGPSGALRAFGSSPGSTSEGGTQRLVALAVDPSNRFVYVLDAANRFILAFQFTDIDGSSPFIPLQGGLFFTALDPPANTPTSIAIEPTGHYLYVTSSATPTSGAVTVYSINQNTGVLTEVGSPVAVNIPLISTGGGTLTGAAVDPSGQFLYAVVNNESSSGFNSIVFAFTINPATGTLTPQSTTFPAGYGASAITITGSVQ
jgi:6-phosphogluconolactonase